MSDDVLSYAAPVPDDPPHPVMRDGDLVVALHEAQFPPRCIHCNDFATRSYRVQWGDASFRVTTLIHRYHEVFLCAEHARQRRRKAFFKAWPILLGVLGLLTAVALSNKTAGETPELRWGLLVGVIGGALLGLGILRVNDSLKVLTVKKVDSHAVHLAGAGLAFLNALPPVPGAQATDSPRLNREQP